MISTDDAFLFAMSAASPLGRSLPKVHHVCLFPITGAGTIQTSWNAELPATARAMSTRLFRS